MFYVCKCFQRPALNNSYTWSLIAALYHANIDFPRMPDVAWDVIDVTLFNVAQFYQNADILL